jgi:hypothetical protein
MNKVKTGYAKSGDVSIAYQTARQGEKRQASNPKSTANPT